MHALTLPSHTCAHDLPTRNTFKCLTTPPLAKKHATVSRTPEEFTLALELPSAQSTQRSLHEGALRTS